VNRSGANTGGKRGALQSLGAKRKKKGRRHKEKDGEEGQENIRGKSN